MSKNSNDNLIYMYGSSNPCDEVPYQKTKEWTTDETIINIDCNGREKSILDKLERLIKSKSSDFISKWNEISKQVHDISVSKGWWESNRSNAETLMLIVTELAECCEGLRHGNPQSESIPEFSNAEEELADTIIRIMDMAVGEGFDLAGAIFAKIEYNKSRPRKHGKEF